MASMSHPPLYGLLHPRPGRWIKGRPRAVAPGAVILQHDFLGASALAPDGGKSTASGTILPYRGLVHTLPYRADTQGASPADSRRGNGLLMYSPVPPRQAGPGPLKI